MGGGLVVQARAPSAMVWKTSLAPQVVSLPDKTVGTAPGRRRDISFVFSEAVSLCCELSGYVFSEANPGSVLLGISILGSFWG